MNKRKVILDCDPGHDDAVAIILAGIDPAIELLGITIVSGNQVLEKTVTNALNVVQKLGLSVPVYPGCGGPMVREKMIASDIHGETGLDGPVFPPLSLEPENKHAVSFLIDAFLKSDKKITMVTTGPMTNLAMALRLAPQIANNIEEIVLMGGAYTNGNVTPAAEFNIVADAEAAYVCFTSGIPITMVGLDVTRKALCYPNVVERMRAVGNSASELFCDLMTFFNRTQKQVFGWEGGPLHDPVTIAYLIDSSVIKTIPAHASVDIRSTESYGRTNIDIFGYQKQTPNIRVAVDIDVAKFWDIIEEHLKMYSDKSNCLE